jgi:hypothetical protein
MLTLHRIVLIFWEELGIGVGWVQCCKALCVCVSSWFLPKYQKILFLSTEMKENGSNKEIFV